MDQVLETAPILLFVIDLAGTVTFLEAQHRVIGIDPQPALGKPAFEGFKDAPERGILVLSPATLVVASVLEDVIERLQPFAAARDVRLVANSDPDLTVHADRARLLQVLWSLASNGIRFTPHGGMVSLTALPSVPFTHIDVTDTGPGIPAHRLSRIYLEFIGEGSPDEGAGLGLSLTRQLVVLMSGRITVSSRFGAGTTFTLRLPASG